MFKYQSLHAILRGADDPLAFLLQETLTTQGR
jgi:hypothetical protein